MKTTYLALLRGVNVGGKNKVPMKELRELLVELRCESVTTYIQSGNVVFKTETTPEAELSAKIEAAILERFGVKSPVILRTSSELRRAVSENPFWSQGVDEAKLFVMFLKEAPSLERVNSLDPNRSSGDSFVVRDRDIFLHITNGVADSKLTNAYFDSKLATISTGRNWRTVNTLLSLLQS